MKLKNIFFIVILLFVNISLSQEDKSNMTFNFIENDNIADVNVDQEKFIKSISQIVDYFNANFKNIPPTQKIGLFINVHVVGNPTYQFFSNPKLDASFEEKVMTDLKKLKIENTKILDFPMFLSLNTDSKGDIVDFPDFINPVKQRIENYKSASLQEKLRLNKEYANSILPVLAAFQINVEDKFQGVQSFGKILQNTKFKENVDVYKLTSLNHYYWRGTLEMSKGNLLFPVTKVFALTSQGELDYAYKYLEIFESFGDKESMATSYINEMKVRINLFNEEFNNEIEKGFVFHDKGEFQKAVDIYNNLLKIYPNSSWCLYEKYYSENAKEIAEKKIEENSRVNWDKAKIEIYKHNPLYNMDVRASTPKEGYLFFRRLEISELFKNNNEFLTDLYKYAEIATDLGIHDFAAQLFWLTASYGGDEKMQEKSIHNFLYCLEKLGVKDLKSNFKGNFVKIFKDIENEKDNEMKKNKIYKSME